MIAIAGCRFYRDTLNSSFNKYKLNSAQHSDVYIYIYIPFRGSETVCYRNMLYQGLYFLCFGFFFNLILLCF